MEMEDPSENWEIQEYSKSDGSNGKLSWILEKGLNLGKKIVITGFVISSAPLVLPPLVVISALGLAVSVPFGLVFVSYTCTEKLMSMLLPEAKSPLMLENGTLSKEEMEDLPFLIEEVDFEGDKMGGEEKYIDYWQEGDENDDQEPVEEVDRSVKEEAYEEDISEEINATEDNRGTKVIEEDEEEPRFNISNEKVEEEGYEEDVGERVKEGQLEGLDVEIEVMGEKKKELVEERSKVEQPLDEVHRVVVKVKRDERNGINVSESEESDLPKTEVVDRESDKKVSSCDEKEGLGSETPGLVENGGDEGDEKKFINGEEMEKPFEVTSVKSEKLNGEMKGTEGERRNEGEKQNKEIQERTTEDNVVELVVEMGSTEKDDKNLGKVVVVEKSSGDVKGSINGNKPGKVAEIIVEQRPVAHKRAEYQSASEVEREKKRKIDSNADAREIADESGFDLFDDRNDASDKYSVGAT